MPLIRQFRQQTGLTPQAPAVFDTTATPNIGDVGQQFFGQKLAQQQAEREEERRRLEAANQQATRNSIINTKRQFDVNFLERVQNDEANIDSYREEVLNHLGESIANIDDEVLKKETEQIIERSIIDQEIKFTQFQREQAFEFAQTQAEQLKQTYRSMYVPNAFNRKVRDATFAEFSELWLESLRPFYTDQQEEALEGSLVFLRQEWEMEALQVALQEDMALTKQAFENGEYDINEGIHLDTAKGMINAAEKQMEREAKIAEQEFQANFYDSELTKVARGTYDDMDPRVVWNNLINEGMDPGAARHIADAIRTEQNRLNSMMNLRDSAGQRLHTSKEAELVLQDMLARNPDMDYYDGVKQVMNTYGNIPDSLKEKMSFVTTVAGDSTPQKEDLEDVVGIFDWMTNPRTGVSRIAEYALDDKIYRDLNNLRSSIRSYNMDYERGYQHWRALQEPLNPKQEQAVQEFVNSEEVKTGNREFLRNSEFNLPEQGVTEFDKIFNGYVEEDYTIYRDLPTARDNALKRIRTTYGNTDYAPHDEPVQYPVETKLKEKLVRQYPIMFGDERTLDKAVSRFDQKLKKDITEKGYFMSLKENKVIPIQGSGFRLESGERDINQVGFGVASVGPSTSLLDGLELTIDPSTIGTGNEEYTVTYRIAGVETALYEDVNQTPYRIKINEYVKDLTEDFTERAKRAEQRRKPPFTEIGEIIGKQRERGFMY